MLQASTNPAQKAWFEDVFLRLAKTDEQAFPVFFRRIRVMCREEAIQVCLQYLGSNDFDLAARRMAIWLSSRDDYVTVLVNPEILSFEAAKRATSNLLKADPRLWVKISDITLYKSSELSDRPARCLALIEAFDKVSASIPFLQGLTTHLNKEIQSKSVKILSHAVSNRVFAERHLQSPDPRIRANAIEGRWGTDISEAKPIFQKAISDPHHRVAANALVGLHLQKDESALPQMIAMAGHEAENFRAAAAWALGYVNDPNALPTLRTLSADNSVMVQKRAEEGIFRLQAESGESETPAETSDPMTLNL